MFAEHAVPEALDPVLFGVLSAAVEEESAAAYEAGFADGLRSAGFRSAPEDAFDAVDDPERAWLLSPPDDPVPWAQPPPGDDGGSGPPRRPQ